MSLPTVKEVLEAYRQTGMKPIDGGWGDIARKHCCPLSVVCLVRQPEQTRIYLESTEFGDKEDELYRIFLAEVFGVSVAEVNAFVGQVDYQEHDDDLGCQAIRAAQHEFGKPCAECLEWIEPGETCDCMTRDEPP